MYAPYDNQRLFNRNIANIIDQTIYLVLTAFLDSHGKTTGTHVD